LRHGIVNKQTENKGREEREREREKKKKGGKPEEKCMQ